MHFLAGIHQFLLLSLPSARGNQRQPEACACFRLSLGYSFMKLLFLFCLIGTLDFQHFIGNGARLGLHFNHIALFSSDERFAHGGFIGNLSLQAVGLGRSHNAEFHLLVILHVQKLYLAANVDLIKVDLVLNHNLCILKQLFQLLDTKLDIPLLILSRIILSILGQVSLLSCFFDFFCNFFSFN